MQLATLLMTFEGAFKIAALEKSVLHRSSCTQIFCKLGVLKNSAKFPRNTCTGVKLHTQDLQLHLKGVSTQVFSCGFFEILRTPF